MTGQPQQGYTVDSERTNGEKAEGGSRRRIWFSLLVLYLSVGFLLTFTMRPQWILPVPGYTDFLDALFNPRIYLSALFWPFWLVTSLFR